MNTKNILKIDDFEWIDVRGGMIGLHYIDEETNKKVKLRGYIEIENE